MRLHRDPDIDSSPIAGKRVAVIGYGNQGRAQALNLRDSGVDVVVGVRSGSPSLERVGADGLVGAPPLEAVVGADIIMLLAPDEHLPAIYREIEPGIGEEAAIGFSHGLAIHFHQIEPRADLDVFLVAPKGPGSALRSLYLAGDGMIALVAAPKGAGPSALPLALAYGKMIGCGRAGLIVSSFAEECEADLFNEQAVVWGAVPEILVAGFDTLVEAGIAPEVAYLECVGELKLLAELIEKRGLAGMREAISNTAELGGTLGGPAIIDDSVRDRMRAVLSGVRDGSFVAALQDEAAQDYPRLSESRRKSREKAIERAFDSLRKIEESS